MSCVDLMRLEICQLPSKLLQCKQYKAVGERLAYSLWVKLSYRWLQKNKVLEVLRMCECKVNFDEVYKE